LTTTVFMLAIGAALAPGTALAQTAEDAFGTWRHPDNGSLISVYQCGGGLCAKVVKVADPSRKDDKNPDPKLRTRPVVGVVIMNGAKKDGTSSWSGKLYNTQDGETYNGTVTVVSKNTLKLQGCVLGGIICQGPTWTRVN
jgi:uncharacterized protein (DUF2147 family)